MVTSDCLPNDSGTRRVVTEPGPGDSVWPVVVRRTRPGLTRASIPRRHSPGLCLSSCGQAATHDRAPVDWTGAALMRYLGISPGMMVVAMVMWGSEMMGGGLEV